ncbi:MAG: hypothetical protein IJ565_04765 [Bacilli bacterium]|nr:hypothetical protein [Bacilli bacterium]
MKIKSYYLTKKDIVVKDYDNKTTIYELNRDNLMNIISNLDKQLDSTIDDVLANEDAAYRKLTNSLIILTILQFFFTYIVFASFTNAMYMGITIGVVLSFVDLLFSVIFSLVSIRKIKLCQKQFKIYEGREILVDKYNSLSNSLDGELVDVY